MIAGPCSVETEEQIVGVAKARQGRPARNMLRGGAFKPRTSPYDFQGLQGRGPRAAEDRPAGDGPAHRHRDHEHPADLPLFEDVDVIQVGARNMQNFDLLKELGKLQQAHSAQARPCQHAQGAADERRIHHGQRQRTTSSSASAASARLTTTRATRSILRRCRCCTSCRTCRSSSIPATPPASTGWSRPWRWPPRPCGADGLIIEVHNDPIHALCDGAQSLSLRAV